VVSTGLIGRGMSRGNAKKMATQVRFGPDPGRQMRAIRQGTQLGWRPHVSVTIADLTLRRSPLRPHRRLLAPG